MPWNQKKQELSPAIQGLIDHTQMVIMAEAGKLANEDAAERIARETMAKQRAENQCAESARESSVKWPDGHHG